MTDDTVFGVRLGTKIKIGAFIGQSEIYNVINFIRDEGCLQYFLDGTKIKESYGITEVTVCRNHVPKFYIPGKNTMIFDRLYEAEEQATYVEDTWITFKNTYPITEISKIIPSEGTLSIAEIGGKWGATANYILNTYSSRITRYDIFEPNQSMAPVTQKIIDKTGRAQLYRANIADILSKGLVPYKFVIFNYSKHYKMDEEVLKELIPHLESTSITCFNSYDIPDVEMLAEDYLDKIPGLVYAIEYTEKGSAILKNLRI